MSELMIQIPLNDWGLVQASPQPVGICDMRALPNHDMEGHRKVQRGPAPVPALHTVPWPWHAAADPKWTCERATWEAGHRPSA